MRALLTDLDRTLTGPDLRLGPAVRERLAELRRHRVAVVVVSGRTLPHMLALGLDEACDGIVAENGGIVCLPREHIYEVLDPGFADLARRALGPLASSFEWGRALASGPRNLAEAASKALDRAGVRHGLSFNAEEVMLLPPGVDKATGARRALARLGIGVASTAAIGDGENDVPMLRLAKLSAAPANAAPEAKAAAQVQLTAGHDEGFLLFTAAILEGRRRTARARATRAEPGIL